jgi:hypothetical protein
MVFKTILWYALGRGVYWHLIRKEWSMNELLKMLWPSRLKQVLYQPSPLLAVLDESTPLPRKGGFTVVSSG